MPGSYRLLHRWRASCHTCPIVLHRGCGLALITPWKGCLWSVWLGSDEGHEQFEGSGQGQGGPGADQRTDGAVAEAVGQVGADGGRNAGAQAPACQGWYGVVAAAGVEDEHAGRQDEPVHGKGQEPGGEAGLAVGGDEFVGCL